MKGLGLSSHLISGRDFRYENISRVHYINIFCPPISEILPTPLSPVELRHRTLTDFAVWSANSERSSGMRYLETTRGVSYAEMGNAHARGRCIVDTHTHRHRHIHNYSVFLVVTISVGLYGKLQWRLDEVNNF